MTTPAKDPRSASDDIDLLSLLEKGLWFFRRYRSLFIPAIILGIVLAILAYFIIPKTYSSRLVAHSVVMTNQENIQIIDNWNRLLKEREYATLAETFGLPLTEIRKLKKIDGSEIQKIFSAVNPNGFYIDAEVTDTKFLPSLQGGIINGFEHSDYARGRLSFRRARLKELIDKLQSEISKLDSTKHDMENIISGKEKPSASVIIDVSTVTKQLIDMDEKLYQLQEELNFTTPLQVLQGFNQFHKRENPKLLVLLVLSLLFFLCIAFVISLTAYTRAKLRERARLSNEPGKS